MADNWSACLQTLEGHRSLVTSVAWSHDATRLASASHDKTVKIWDPATGVCVSTLEGHRSRVTSVAWSHDATRLASASYDGTVKIWDPAMGVCVSKCEIGGALYYLQFHSSDSDLLHTELGTFDLRGVATSTDSGPSAPNYISSPLTVGFGLNSSGTWITYQGKNRLWLPPEYRPEASAVSGTVVSMGCSSGRVLILTFSESPLLS